MALPFDLDAHLRTVATTLAEIEKQMPEMSGFDLAFDRGNITHDEWKEAASASQAGLARQQEEVAKLDQLRLQYPTEMTTYVDTLLARLEGLRETIDSRLATIPDDAQGRRVRFQRILFPDLIACLRAWSIGASAPQSPTWAWRLVYTVIDECALVLDRDG